MSEGKIRTIDGGELKGPVPNPDLIKECEDLLAMAKSGEIKYLVYAALHHDNSSSHNDLGSACNRGRKLLIGCLQVMSTELSMEVAGISFDG